MLLRVRSAGPNQGRLYYRCPDFGSVPEQKGKPWRDRCTFEWRDEWIEFIDRDERRAREQLRTQRERELATIGGEVRCGPFISVHVRRGAMSRKCVSSLCRLWISDNCLHCALCLLHAGTGGEAAPESGRVSNERGALPPAMKGVLVVM